MIVLLDRHWTLIKIEKRIHAKMNSFFPLLLLSLLYHHHHHHQVYQFDLKEELDSFGHWDDLRSMLVGRNHKPRKSFFSLPGMFEESFYFRTILFNANSSFVTNTEIIQCCGIRTIFGASLKSFNTELKISGFESFDR